MHARNFFTSVFWFSIGVVLNRIKYILITSIVIQLGLVQMAIFYFSIHYLHQLAVFFNRIISSSYNRFLRDDDFISQKENLMDVIYSSLQLSFIFGIIGGVFVYISAVPIAILFKNELLTPAIVILAIGMPFLIVTGQVIRIMSMLKKFKEAVLFHSFVETFIVVGSAFVSILVFHADFKTVLLWQVYAMITSCLLALCLLFFSVSGFTLFFRFLPKKATISAVTFNNSLFIFIIDLADLFIVGYFLGIRNLAIYFAMLVAPHLIYQIGTNIFSMYLHTASSFYNDKKRLSLFSQRVMQGIVTILVPLVILFFLYPQEMFSKILYIHTPLDAVAVKLLSLAFFLRTISWMAGQILIVTKKNKENMKIHLILSALAVPLLIIFVPWGGFLAVAVLFCILFALECIIKVFLVYHLSSVYFLSSKSIKTLFLSIFIIFVFTYGFRVDFLAFLLYFPPSFCVLLLLFGCIGKEEFALIKRKIGPKESFVTFEDV